MHREKALVLSSLLLFNFPSKVIQADCEKPSLRAILKSFTSDVLQSQLFPCQEDITCCGHSKIYQSNIRTDHLYKGSQHCESALCYLGGFNLRQTGNGVFPPGSEEMDAQEGISHSNCLVGSSSLYLRLARRHAWLFFCLQLVWKRGMGARWEITVIQRKKKKANSKLLFEKRKEKHTCSLGAGEIGMPGNTGCFVEQGFSSQLPLVHRHNPLRSASGLHSTKPIPTASSLPSSFTGSN